MRYTNTEQNQTEQSVSCLFNIKYTQLRVINTTKHWTFRTQPLLLWCRI